MNLCHFYFVCKIKFDQRLDFYIPDDHMAIQVCYDLESDEETAEREVKGLLKITKVLECERLLIITRDSEKTLNREGRSIEVVPIWKWLLEEIQV